MENAPYLVDSDFHVLYMKEGFKAANNEDIRMEYPYITPEAVVVGRNHMYGAIQSSCSTVNHIMQFLMIHRKTSDGIQVWLDLLSTYDNKGNLDVQMQTYEDMTKVSYTSRYPGGILSYLANFQQGYAGLAMHGRIYSEAMKLAQLKDNIFKYMDIDNPIRLHLTNTCKTLQEWYDFLRKYGTEKDHQSGHIARHKAHLTLSAFPKEDEEHVTPDMDLKQMIAYLVNQQQQQGPNMKIITIKSLVIGM